jgi:hypothetical protein
MNTTKLVMAMLFLPGLLIAQEKVTAPLDAANLFPRAKFRTPRQKFETAEEQGSSGQHQE